MTLAIKPTTQATTSDAERLLEAYGRHTGAAGRGRGAALGWDFVVARTEGAYVVDTDGRRYLDCHGGGGIANLGHRPPALVEALARAARETDQGNFPLISSEKAALARDLAAFVGGGLECTTFAVARGEAVDFACKLARAATGRKTLLAAEGCWFGQTGFALSLSTRADKALFGPLIPETRVLPLAHLLEAIGPGTAGVFVELLQVENGCAAIPEDTLRALRARCAETGALLVFDETQTGFGRTGRRFAFSEAGVEPDVLVVGEALGAGMFPIAATLATQRAHAFMHAHPLIHLSTFGGADVGCAVARVALAQYAAARPWEDAARSGARLHAGLAQVAQRHPAISGVAGRGLVACLALGTPAHAVGLCRALARAGVLAAPGDVARHTVVLRPSLLIDEAEVEFLLETVGRAAAQV